MLIPIGFFGAGAAAGAYELIQTSIIGSAISQVTFNSIPSTYKHLQVRFTARNSSSASNQNLAIQFNNTGGTAYSAHRLIGNGSSVSSEANSSTFYSIFGVTVANSQTANIFTGGIIDVLDYASTSKNTTIRALSGFAGSASNRIILGSGAFANTAAITRLDLTMNTGDFMVDSRFSLYGIKG
jgi:hypothetical protein